MTDIDTFTKYKEQKQIFEQVLKRQFELLENCTNSSSFKEQKEYHKNLSVLQKEFKKLLRSFTNVKEKTISLEKYTRELKDINELINTKEKESKNNGDNQEIIDNYKQDIKNLCLGCMGWFDRKIGRVGRERLKKEN